MVRLIASDLDGTLLNSARQISERNRAAVRAVVDAGVIFCLASGRGISTMTQYLVDLGLVGPVVSSNGAYVTGLCGEEVHHFTLPAGAQALILDYAREEGVHLNCYAGSEIMFSHEGEFAEMYRSRTGCSPVIGGYDGISAIRPTKLLYVDHPERIVRHGEAVGPGLREMGVSVVVSEPDYIEFLPPGITKGAGLEALCRHLQIDRSEVAAIGDWLNDLEMVEWAGVSGAVANGAEEVRVVADHLVATNDEDGVAEFVDGVLPGSVWGYIAGIMSRLRTVFFSALVAMSTSVMAATIAVTDPTANDFWGRNNTVQFNLSGMTVKAEVTVKAISGNDPNVVVTQKKEFTPDGNGKASGSIAMNFAETQLVGPYTIEVTASSTVDNYNTPAPIPITLDVKDPKFDNFNPISGVFVRDIERITATFIEDNLKEWKVTINGNDIPSNLGATTSLSVDWDTSTIINDGPQTIAIRVEDQAGNTANQSISVTLDRLPPTANILSPVGGQVYRPGTSIPVVVQISDQFGGAIDDRTVDVVIETTTGTFLTRGSLISTSSSGNTLTWTGRIRDTSSIPTKFVVRVKSRDKAGNVGNDQVVTVDTSGRGRGLVDLLINGGDGSSGSVKDAAMMAMTRGGMSALTRSLFSRSRRQLFGRGYN